MTSTAFLLQAFARYRNMDAIVWRHRRYSYSALLEQVCAQRGWLERSGLPRGSIVALNGDYSPQSVALLLALIDHACVVVPISPLFRQKRQEFYDIAEVQFELVVDDDASPALHELGTEVRHEITRALSGSQRAGLVIFSSGSTGRSKAAVHDCEKLLKKFQVPRRSKCTIPFMLFDHIGGINTLMHTLSSGGTVVIVEDRNPDTVCSAIAAHRVQVLPTSPTFLGLMLMHESYRRHDLSSLEIIAYGAESMPEATLQRLHDALPQVRLAQNYGVSEVGVLHSQSEASNSVWIKLGGEGYRTRVRDGMLEIFAESAMLGYLNAPSPFTDDGWFKTGDMVEVRGDYMRILGRNSEMINVGGEKVYPAEVEGEIARMEGVVDVAVSAEPHALVGSIVKATVQLGTDETAPEFRQRMTVFLADKLPQYKIPRKILLTDSALYGDRFKKMRRGL